MSQYFLQAVVTVAFVYAYIFFGFCVCWILQFEIKYRCTYNKSRDRECFTSAY